MHCASARTTEVTVHTPAWWPTSVSPLSSWPVNTIWSPRAVPSKLCSVVSASTVKVVCLCLSLEEPQAGLIAPTASATSAIAVPATPKRLPIIPPCSAGRLLMVILSGAGNRVNWAFGLSWRIWSCSSLTTTRQGRSEWRRCASRAQASAARRHSRLPAGEQVGQERLGTCSRPGDAARRSGPGRVALAPTRDVAQLGQRTCFGSSPKKAQCEAAFPQDRRDRHSPNQVLSSPRLGVETRTLARLLKSYRVVAALAGWPAVPNFVATTRARAVPYPPVPCVLTVYRRARSRPVADASGAPALATRDRSASWVRQGRCRR